MGKKMGSYMGGKYLRKDDVDFKGLDVTIYNITDETIGDELETKPVLHFREHGVKPLVLNKTNIGYMIAVFGSDDSDDWVGRRVNLWNDPSVNFNGVRGGLRVRLCQDAAQVRAGAQSKKIVAQADMFDDDIPANM